MKPWKISPSANNLIQKIIDTTKPFQVILFGSRARGNYRENSDIDLCVVKKNCSEDLWNRLLISIHDDPYTLLGVDLVEFENLSQLYQDDIKKIGVVLYESNPKLSKDPR